MCKRECVSHVAAHHAGDGLHDLAAAALPRTHELGSALPPGAAPGPAIAAHAGAFGHAALAALPPASDALNAAGEEPIAVAHVTMRHLGASLFDSLASMRVAAPAAYESVSASLASVVDAVNELLHEDAQTAARHAAAMLGSFTQQLVWATQTAASGPAAAALLAASQTASGAGAHGARCLAPGGMSAACSAPRSRARAPRGYRPRLLTLRGVRAGELGATGLAQVTVATVALMLATVPVADATTPGEGSDAPPDAAELPSQYDPAALRAYFARRPVCVMRRRAEVAGKLSAFLVAILADWRTGQWDRRAADRAVWLRTIFEGLGPAYVKIAQALSTRVDMLPEVYLHEFRKLQDAVAPFPTSQARDLIEAELDAPIQDLFEDLSPESVASASLGQVYRGTLRAEYGGGRVAVKVQRPGVMERVALDTLLMREAAELISTIPTFSESWAGVLDDWATRFFQVRAHVRATWWSRASRTGGRRCPGRTLWRARAATIRLKGSLLRRRWTTSLRLATCSRSARTWRTWTRSSYPTSCPSSPRAVSSSPPG